NSFSRPRSWDSLALVCCLKSPGSLIVPPQGSPSWPQPRSFPAAASRNDHGRVGQERAEQQRHREDARRQTAALHVIAHQIDGQDPPDAKGTALPDARAERVDDPGALVVVDACPGALDARADIVFGGVGPIPYVIATNPIEHALAYEQERVRHHVRFYGIRLDADRLRRPSREKPVETLAGGIAAESVVVHRMKAPVVVRFGFERHAVRANVLTGAG